MKASTRRKITRTIEILQASLEGKAVQHKSLVSCGEGWRPIGEWKDSTPESLLGKSVDTWLKSHRIKPDDRRKNVAMEKGKE